MKLEERRALIEILLCAPCELGCMAAADALGFDPGLGRKASNMLWSIASTRRRDVGYADRGCEAAYRLIESSPTLVREYFGKEQSQ